MPIAISIPGALATVLVAVVAFLVVIGVCFVVLRLVSFVTGGDEEPNGSGDGSESS